MQKYEKLEKIGEGMFEFIRLVLTGTVLCCFKLPFDNYTGTLNV